MEQSTIQENPLFIAYEPLVEKAGLKIVEIHRSIQGHQAKLEVYVTGIGKDADSDDCARAYHAAIVRYWVDS